MKMNKIMIGLALAVGAAISAAPAAGRAGSDRYCREYQDIANINGRAQQVYGTACLEDDGSWSVRNARPVLQNSRSVFRSFERPVADTVVRKTVRVYDERSYDRSARHPYYRDAGVTITAPLDITIGHPQPVVREEVYYETVAPRPARTTYVTEYHYYDDDDSDERYVRRYRGERRGHCHGGGHGRHGRHRHD